jgi:hypothetical protein
VSDPIDKSASLTPLIDVLRARGYRFITPTPATHARVLTRRKGETARDLRDVFGWSMPFARDVIDRAVFEALAGADALEAHGALFKSRLRASNLGDDILLHSAFPTTQPDAVFFGPDSYRFAAFIAQELARLGPRKCIADIGAGTGVGALTVARCERDPPLDRILLLNDINAKALELAAANLFAADVRGGVLFSQSDGLGGLDLPLDLIIANPPYIADAAHRAYRDGGAMHGGEVSLAWTRAAAERLTRGGAFLLYTGSAIVAGEDRLKAALFDALAGFDVSYREIDPDVFGEELEREDYADVERIAVVGLAAVKR